MASATYAAENGDEEIEIIGDSIDALSVNDPLSSEHVESSAGSSGSSRNGQENQRPSPMIEIRKIFVGGIDRRVPKYTLEAFFSVYGQVQNAHVPWKPDGIREQYGFITYFEPEDAERALLAGQKGLELMGRRLNINKAELRHQPIRLPNGKIQWFQRRPPSNKSSYGKPKYVKHKLPEVIDESKCFVGLLNDDCLMHIFSFLDKKTLFRLESVSKRWRDVSMQMWRSVKHLDFDWLPCFEPGASAPLTTHILRQIMVRCGPNIQNLDMSHKPTNLRGSAFRIIADNCPNLLCLTLSECNYISDLQSLHNVSGRLQRVLFHRCTAATDTDLGNFFTHCPRLTSVSVTENPNLTGAFLADLNSDKIEELILDNCSGMQDQSIVRHFLRLTNLKRLSMNGCMYLRSNVVEDIFKSLPQLEAISLSNRFPLLQGYGLAALSHLTELVSLTLYLNAAVNDEVLRAVAKSCKKLEHLDISGCSVLGFMVEHTVTDNGIVHIAQMPKLTHVKMSYMAILTDQALESLAEKGKLKKLECRGCPTFTDFGCSRVVSLCNELECFDMSGCNFITSDVVAAANMAVKLRTNNVKLKLIVGGTEIYVDDRDLEPLLELDDSNHCVDQHRPDFVDDHFFMPGSDDSDTSDEDFDFQYDDEIGHFDLDCQEMFHGDDLADLFMLRAAQGYFNDSDSDFDDDDLNFMVPHEFQLQPTPKQ